MLAGLGLGFLAARLGSKEAQRRMAAGPGGGPLAVAGRAGYAMREQMRYAWKQAQVEVGEREKEMLEEFRHFRREQAKLGKRKKKRGLFGRER